MTRARTFAEWARCRQCGWRKHATHYNYEQHTKVMQAANRHATQQGQGHDVVVNLRRVYRGRIK